MKRSTVLTYVAIGLLALPFAIGKPGSADATPGHDMTVDNTAANPVPITIIGSSLVSGSVSIANQPTVDARQSGAWSVGIAGTPSVNLAGTPAVTIANGAATPVLVRDVSQPVRTPFDGSVSLQLAPGEFNGCQGGLTVPAGQRLVVEHLTLYAQAPADQEMLYSLEMTNSNSGGIREHWLEVHRNQPGSIFATANQPILGYGAPGTNVCLHVRRMSNSAADMVLAEATLDGYTIPAP